jgi:hypothetical protein
MEALLLGLDCIVIMVAGIGVLDMRSEAEVP